LTECEYIAADKQIQTNFNSEKENYFRCFTLFKSNNSFVKLN
jgi:hypothetical protein